jgi:hypothetical protein
MYLGLGPRVYYMLFHLCCIMFLIMKSTSVKRISDLEDSKEYQEVKRLTFECLMMSFLASKHSDEIYDSFCQKSTRITLIL